MKVAAKRLVELLDQAHKYQANQIHNLEIEIDELQRILNQPVLEPLVDGAELSGWRVRGGIVVPAGKTGIRIHGIHVTRRGSTSTDSGEPARAAASHLLDQKLQAEGLFRIGGVEAE